MQSDFAGEPPVGVIRITHHLGGAPVTKQAGQRSVPRRDREQIHSQP